MLHIFVLTISVLLVPGPLLCLWPLAGGQPPAMSCHSIILTDELSSGNRFEKALGGNLVFRVDPERLGSKREVDGSRITLVPSRTATTTISIP